MFWKILTALSLFASVSLAQTPTPTFFPLTPISCCQIDGSTCSNTVCNNIGNVIIGNVCSGTACSPPTPAITPSPREADLPNVSVGVNTSGSAFLIHIGPGSSNFTFGLKFEYDASLINIDSVSLQPYDSACSFSQIIFNGIPGSVTVYIACTTALGGDGDLLYLSFSSLGTAGTTALTWDYCILDSGYPAFTCTVVDGSIEVTGPTQTPTSTNTITQTPSPTQTPSITSTVLATPNEWDGIFFGPDTPSPTPSFTITSTPANTGTPTQTIPVTSTATQTVTLTPSRGPSTTQTPGVTEVPTPDDEDVSFFTEDTPTPTPRPSFSPTPTKTPTFLTPVPTATRQICCDCGNDCIAAERGICPPQCTPVPGEGTPGPGAVCL